MLISEDIILAKFSLFIMESCFHLLSDINVEEDLRRIVTALPLSIVTSTQTIIKHL